MQISRQNVAKYQVFGKKLIFLLWILLVGLIRSLYTALMSNFHFFPRAVPGFAPCTIVIWNHISHNCCWQWLISRHVFSQWYFCWLSPSFSLWSSFDHSLWSSFDHIVLHSVHWQSFLSLDRRTRHFCTASSSNVTTSRDSLIFSRYNYM